MNLIEAIKTGKQFRRPGESWRWKEGLKYSLHASTTFSGAIQQQTANLATKTLIDVSMTDLLADDWEVREPEVTITRRVLAEVIREATYGDSPLSLVDYICKKLGL